MPSNGGYWGGELVSQRLNLNILPRFLRISHVRRDEILMRSVRKVKSSITKEHCTVGWIRTPVVLAQGWTNTRPFSVSESFSSANVILFTHNACLELNA